MTVFIYHSEILLIETMRERVVLELALRNTEIPCVRIRVTLVGVELME